MYLWWHLSPELNSTNGSCLLLAQDPLPHALRCKKNRFIFLAPFNQKAFLFSTKAIPFGQKGIMIYQKRVRFPQKHVMVSQKSIMVLQKRIMVYHFNNPFLQNPIRFHQNHPMFGQNYIPANKYTVALACNGILHFLLLVHRAGAYVKHPARKDN